MGLRTALADWSELCKLRIGGFVVFAAFAGALLTADAAGSLSEAVAPALLVGLLVGCTAAAAGIFNQVLERELDARMDRTRNRPLPAGRVSPRDAIFVGTLLLTIGTAGLAIGFTLLSAFLALATLIAYTLVYTPLKRYSSLNTVVGAVPGAMPPLIGAAAFVGETGLHMNGWGMWLFAVIFVWQFPHFLAIAWIYRVDYAKAGMKMLPALPGSEGISGRQAFVYALTLIPISLLPCLRGEAGGLYALTAILGGLAYLAASASFAQQENRVRARRLVLVSLVYLPLVFASALVEATILHSIGFS